MASATFVLLHGAWHGAWCWQRVAEPLRDAGHTVYTPTQTGLGERAHLLSTAITLETFIQDLLEVLEGQDLHDVILVGHSFGGVAITGAADRVPSRIRHLVYLDALVLENGQSPFSMVPPDVADARRKLARETSAGLSIPPPAADAFGVTDLDDAAWVEARCTPHPLSTYEDRLLLNGPVGNGLPATYIAVQPDYPPFAQCRAFARGRSDWDYRHIDAGHDAMITSPRALTDMLRDIHQQSGT